MSTVYGFIPLRYTLGWPSETFPLPTDGPMADILDRVAVTNTAFSYDEETGDAMVAIGIEILGEIALSPPGLDDVEFTLNAAGGVTTLDASIRYADGVTTLEISDITLGLRITNDLIRPARAEGDEFVLDEAADGTVEPYEIALSNLSLIISSTGNIWLTASDGTAPTLTMDPAMIGNSGIVIESDSIGLYFDSEAELPVGAPTGFKGVYIPEAAIHLPESLKLSFAEDLTFTACYIGTGGFTGTVTASAGDEPSTLSGLAFAFDSFTLSFVQNTITAGGITGELSLPFFKQADGSDTTVDVAVSFALDGSMKIAISDDDADGLVTASTALGDLTLSGLAFGLLEDGTAYVELAGSLDLVEIGGIDLPKISVNGLRITSAGDISMASSSGIGLEEQVIIDLKGFLVEIDAIGFGTESDKNFVSFTGGVKLTEALPMGVSAKGLQVLWSKDPETIVDGDSVDVIASKLGLGVQCEGIGISFEIPDVLLISGAVTFDNENERFSGKGQLNLLSLDMTIDAAFIVGKAEGAGEAEYRYFGVQLETQLPFGIPLGNTGIALFGFSGLFAQNMAPLTVEGVDGFSFDTGEIKQITFVEDEFHWYKDWYRPASGFYEPWTPQEGAFGFGVGTVIGTQPDNGFTISIDKALVFAFPGPIIMLQGKGNMLTARSALSDETKQPIFSSLILFDGNEKSILAALGMDYSMPAVGDAGAGGILDAHALSEAFFDFDDATNWHLYLGEIEKEKRIRAEVFRLFQADSYLMLENSGMRAGVSIGIDESFDFEVVSAGLKAWLAGDAVITWAPQYLWGNVDLDADLWLEAFGFEFSMSAHAGIAAQTPTPKELEVDLQFTLDLPWPFDPVDVDINMRWYEEQESSPVSPLCKEMSIRDFISTDCWTLTALADSLDTATSIAEIEPYLSPGSVDLAGGMPLDARPAVTFTRNVVDNSGVAADVPVVALEDGGDHEYGYELSSVELHKWDDDALGWSGPLDLTGYWQETGKNSATMLELYGDGPFSFCRNNTSMASGDPGDAPPFWIPYTDAYLAVNAGGSGYPIDLTPTELDFEDYAAGDVLGAHNLGPVFTGNRNPATVAADPAGIMALPIQVNLDPVRTPTSIHVLFPEATQLQSMKFHGVNAAAASAWVEIAGNHADGTSVPVRPRFELPNASTEFAMPTDFANVVSITMTGQYAYLEGFTYIARATLDAAGDMSADAVALLDDRICLEPDTIYRLSVSANIYTDKEIANFDPALATSTESRYSFFRTQGPPIELGPYVAAEIPASVESPHYAGYDLTLEFNQNYIRTMYADDISVEVVDENGIAATDASGNAVIFETVWRSVTVEGAYTTRVYLGALADAGVRVPPDTSVENDVLDARITSGNSLPPGKRLQARFRYPDYETPIHTTVFTTSEYADFSSLVDDFRADAWQESIATAPAVSAVTDFDAAMTAFGFGQRNLPARPDVTGLYATDRAATVALLLELPEPVEWERVALAIGSAPGTLSRLVNNDGTRAIIYAASGASLAAWTAGSHTLSFTFSRSSGDLTELREGGSIANETRSVSIAIP